MTGKEQEETKTKEQVQTEILQKEYDRLAQEHPVRTVDMPGAPGTPDSDGRQAQTLGESIDRMEDLTDLQYAMAKLFPSTVEANSVMIARIDPNVYIPMLHIMSVNEIMQANPDEDINVDMIWMKNNILLSIGLDGMGRIDTAELLGAAREEKRAEKMLRAGGI